MAEYNNQEQAKMHFIYGLCNGSALESARTYAARYANRRQPSPRTFTALHRRLCETGTFEIRRERGTTSASAEIENRVLLKIQNNPTTSMRMVEKRLGIPRSTAWNVVHNDHQHPYHFTPVQTISAEEKVQRKAYCQTMILRTIEDTTYLRRIL